jgi:hypothetical protein
MSRSYTSPQAPPWRVAGLFYFFTVMFNTLRVLFVLSRMIMMMMMIIIIIIIIISTTDE